MKAKQTGQTYLRDTQPEVWQVAHDGLRSAEVEVPPGHHP